MNQLSLFDVVETSSVVDTEPAEDMDMESVEVMDSEPAPDESWRAYDRELQEYYRPLPDVTDPDGKLTLTWYCRYHRNVSVGLSAPVKLSDLNPDIIYCRHPGGAWEQKEPLPCWTCAKKVADLFVNILK